MFDDHCLEPVFERKDGGSIDQQGEAEIILVVISLTTLNEVKGFPTNRSNLDIRPYPLKSIWGGSGCMLERMKNCLST